MFEAIAGKMLAGIATKPLGDATSQLLGKFVASRTLKAALTKHVEMLSNRHGKMTIYRSGPVDLADAFILPKIVHLDAGRVFLTSAEHRMLSQSVPMGLSNTAQATELDAHYRSSLQRLQFFSSRNIEIHSLHFDRDQNTIFLAQPGGGKSTVLSWYILNELRRDQPRIPYFLDSQRLSKDDVLTALQNWLTTLGGEAALVHDIQDKILLILDGLDEVSQNRMKQVCKELREIQSTLPKLRVICACRSAAYNGELSSYRETTILPFNEEQIRAFVQTWFGERQAESGQKLEELIMANPRVLEISSQPLMISLVCNAFERFMDISSRSSALYDQCVEALFWVWDADRGIVREPIFENIDIEKTKWLHAFLAFQLHSRRKRNIDLRELTEILSEYAPKLGLSNDQITKLVGGISSDIGLLERFFENVYGFRHLGLQEFMAARWISQEARWIDVLTVENLRDPWWREVAGLCIGMLSDATVAIQSIFDMEELTDLDRLEAICSSFRFDPILDEGLRRHVLNKVLNVLHNGTKPEMERALRMLVDVDDAWSKEILSLSLAGALPKEKDVL